MKKALLASTLAILAAASGYQTMAALDDATITSICSTHHSAINAGDCCAIFKLRNLSTDITIADGTDPSWLNDADICNNGWGTNALSCDTFVSPQRITDIHFSNLSLS